MTAPERRRALVLGASRGIGAAVARRLDADGYAVTLVGRNRGDLGAIAEPLTDASVLALDVTTGEGRAELVGTLERDGLPHAVVAGVHARRPWSRIASTAPETYGAAVDDHLAHVAAVARAAVPFQRTERFGRWVMISSLVARLGGHGQGHYVAHKAAMEVFARALAVEEGPFGITANVVVPGFVAADHMAARYSPDQLDAFGRRAAVRRPGTPEEVAHAVSFLADPLAGFVTGATIPVTGGAELSWWLAPDPEERP